MPMTATVPVAVTIIVSLYHYQDVSHEAYCVIVSVSATVSMYHPPNLRLSVSRIVALCHMEYEWLCTGCTMSHILICAQHWC